MQNVHVDIHVDHTSIPYHKKFKWHIKFIYFMSRETRKRKQLTPKAKFHSLPLLFGEFSVIKRCMDRSDERQWLAKITSKTNDLLI